MNIKHRKTIGVLTIVLVHLFFIYLGGYFLSPEFTLYPYLTSVGLKPYLNLIDQHLPVVFFGPLSLPSFLTKNPQPLLALWLTVVALTDILFFKLLEKKKTRNSLFWTALFAISLFVFSGNTLWLETFIVPIILLSLFQTKTSKGQFFIGILAALAVLIRPTLAPAILLLLIFKKSKLSRYLIAGLAVPLLTTLTYLIYHQLLPSFMNIFFKFNTTYYSALAGQLPTLKQLILVVIVIFPSLIALLRSKRYLPALIVTLSFLLAWPRFELIHLQPALAFAIFFSATNNSPGRFNLLILPRILFFILILLSIKKLSTVNYGNFYLTNEVREISSYIKKQDQNQIFILGGSDLIYSLSHKNPAGDYYLPSLPWYYQNPDFVVKQIEALKFNKEALVIINQNSSVNKIPVSIFAKPVFEYILDNYSLTHTISQYQIYKIKQ